jgi:hypothetical protein
MDLYYHPSKWDPALIARYGNEVWQYVSGPADVFGQRSPEHVLSVALLRAVEAGLCNKDGEMI